ncbi:DUF2339 domain-containing protein [Nocardia sp. NPDC051750]|uniref:DUF2339 domain-containing protein n=1 Tax=Nocardia sp. NPDC051750 TaxID=3364325 RepID=UPI0037ADBE31
MTTSIDPALVARLSGEFDSLAGDFTALGGQLGTLGRDLESLHQQVLSAVSARAGSAGQEQTTASPEAVPPTGVRVGGVHTPDTPGAATSISGGAAPGHRDRASRPLQRSAHQAADQDAPAHAEQAEQGEAGATAGPENRTTPGHGVRPVPDTSAHAASAAQEQGAPGHAPQSDSVHALSGTPAPAPSGELTEGGPAAQARAPWGVPPQPPTRPATTARMYREAVQQYPGAVGAGHPYPGSVPPRPPGVRGPVPPRTPWWQREGVISRVLAVAGVAVTLIGVVMLLVLAAQAGIFGPVPRVVSGAVLSAALVGAGMRVYRRAGGRVGGIALAATGFAGAYLDVVAVTTIYGWLHPIPGFAAALGVAAAGVGLAVQWRSQPLAALVVAGAAVLAPFLTTDLALLAFLVVLQLACVPVQIRHDWPFLHLVRTVPAALTMHLTIVAYVIDAPDGNRPALVLTAAVAMAAVGLAGTVLVVRTRPGDLVASMSCALAITPLLAAPALFERPAATAISSVYAVVLLAVAATALVPKVRDRARIPGHTAIVAATGGSFALLETCWGVTTAGTLPLALFLVACCYLGIAGQSRNRVPVFLGLGYAALGALAFLAIADPETLTAPARAAGLSLGAAASAVAGLGVVAVGLWALRRTFGPSIDEAGTTLLWIGGSAAALYLVTAATVSFGVASGTADGFVIGHSIATIIWMAGALAALQYGLRNLGAETPATAKVALGSGLLVSAAALAKLFLFDLATLDGLIRVAAFLVVGILLLIAGTRYARAFAETTAREQNRPA